MTTLLCAILIMTQDPKPPLINQKDVDEAIKRGHDWLLSKVKEGLPGDVALNGGKGLTYDGLVLYTLKHAGCDVNDGTIQRLIATVKGAKPTRTYQVATHALALALIDPNKYRETLAIYAQYLVDQICDNGQWGYGDAYEVPVPAVPVASGEGASTTAKFKIKKSKKFTPAAVGDNSNTQYAALGLWACSKAGVEFDPEFLDRAIKWWETTQQPDGGWGYSDQGKFDDKHGTYGAMTAGGAGSLVILRKLRGHDPKSSAARKGIQWCVDHWAVDKNPATPQDRLWAHFYFLYALERLGDLFGTEKMGKHLWYAEGADYLLKTQKVGTWCGTNAGFMIPDTCFGVLFLKRSMAVATTSAADKK